jgi:D-alanyl-D-alanine carboxypeptidase
MEGENNVEQTNKTISPDYTRQPVFWQLVVLMLLLIFIFSSAIVTEITEFAERTLPNNENQNANAQAATVISSRPAENKQIEGVSVAAKSAYVFDIQTGEILYSKNENETLPLASVTKLMTALLAHEILAEKSTVGVTYNAIAQEGDSGLMGGERFSRQTLSDMVLMTSSNDGAYALAEAAGGELTGSIDASTFIEAMNLRAEQLDLNSLEFYNPTGLDLSENQAGAFGSAKDIGQLMAYIVRNYPEILAGTKETRTRFYNQNGDYHNAQNTNSTVNRIPGLIGSKTGYTTLAGGNLVIAFDAGLNHPIVIVVLGSSRDGRFEDVLKLTKATQQLFIE